jgi:hypothetical protein
MSNDKPTTETPADEPKEAAPAKPVRKIVRRSAATRDNPAYVEPAAAAPAAEAPAAAALADASAAAAPAASAAAAPAASSVAAPAADAAGVASAPSGAPAGARPRATFDARAPRPRTTGATGEQGRGPRPPRTGDRAFSSGSGGDRRGSGSGDYRPPPARPVGARPIPGGPRAPSAEGERPQRSAGDFRPPPPRPMGARPLPGGSRAPAPTHEHRERPTHDRAPRDGADHERSAHRAPRDAAPGDAGARPAARPAPKPVAKVEAPKPAAKPAPKAMPVFIPLARAGQVTPQSAKPALTPKEALAAKTKAHAPKPAAKPAKAGGTPANVIDADLIGASADGAIAAIAKAGDAAAALVDAWATANNAAAIAEVAEAEAVPGAARKAARRALNVLRSRGVAIPTRAPGAKKEERVDVEAEAVLTPPDSVGTFMLAITKREPSGRFHLAELVIREPHGVLQAWGGWLSGTQIKEGRARQLGGYGLAPVPVPLAWARHRIAQARALNASSGQVLPLGFDRCLALLDPVPEAAPPHPLAELEASVTAEAAAAAAAGSAQLHDEPEFRGWLVDRPAIDEMLGKLGERIGPQGTQMDREAFDAAMAEEIAAATDRHFTPEVRQALAARMRDAAISIRGRKDERAAAGALAVARAIVDAGLITSPPREIPFLVRFFDRGLRALAQQAGGQLRVPVAAGAPAPGAPPA